MIERKEISIDNLVIDTAQSRQGDWAGDEQDQQLVNSLERDGLLQSLLVRPVENTPYAGEVSEEYAIVAGSRRYHAAVEAGFDTVHCRIIEADDFEAAKKSLKENEERKELTDEEVARSLRMQFEMLRPDESQECPNCGADYANLSQHWATSDCESVSPPSRPQSREGELTFYTDRQVYEYLAEEHFGGQDKPTGVKKIQRFIRIAELPDTLRSLWKPEGQRTESQQEALENFNIDRDLTASRGGDLSRLGDEVLKLHNKIEEKADSDALNPTNAVLETVGRLDFDQSETDLQQEIKRFGVEVDEIAEIDDPQKQERAFRARLEDKETQIRELNEELGQPSMPRVNFRLSDLADQADQVSAQQYRRYHARVKQQLGVESNAEVARRAYRQYLIEQAEQNGWN